MLLHNIFQHYDFLSETIPKYNIRSFFSKRLRYILNNPQLYIPNYNLNMLKYSSIYYFEYIKEDIIKVLITQVDSKYRSNLKLVDFTNSEFRDTLYEVLLYYNLKDLVIPFYIWLNYYSENNLDLIESNMNYLISKKFKFNSLDELYNLGRGNTFFRLPYLEENNKELLQKVCRFYRIICPQLNYKAETTKLNISNKKRIGFISERLKYDSSVLRDRMGIIQNLNNDDFDVFIIVSSEEQLFFKSAKGNYAKEFYHNNKECFIFLPNSIQDSSKIIEFLNLDIIVYCEIGMDFKTYLLSYQKLAPIQINTWGHSETSGIDSIDYFISSKYYEIEDAQQYYSEKVICFQSLSTYYQDFQYIDDKQFDIREKYGFSEHDNIICCLQASFKISDFMDQIFDSLLKNPNTYILLSVAFAPFSSNRLKKMKEKIGNKCERLKFYPILSLNDYMNLINISDIVLDPYPFGGCNSSLEAFYLNKPIVTLPSKRINGRFTYGFYQKMDISDCIVKNQYEYINKCFQLINDKKYYNNISKKIQDNKSKLFNEKDSINEWNNLLKKI